MSYHVHPFGVFKDYEHIKDFLLYRLEVSKKPRFRAWRGLAAPSGLG